MTVVLKSLNLALAFALELAMLVAFGIWGYHAGHTPLVRYLLAIGLPVFVAALWGAVMAPRAKRRLRGAAYLAVKLVLFSLAAVALATSGMVMAAIVFAALCVLNTVLLYIWE